MLITCVPTVFTINKRRAKKRQKRGKGRGGERKRKIPGKQSGGAVGSLAQSHAMRLITLNIGLKRHSAY